MVILSSCEEDKFQMKGKEERIFERTTGSSNRGSEKRRPIGQEEVPISITKAEFSKKDEHDPQANETYPNSPIKGTITSVRRKRKPKLFGFGNAVAQRLRDLDTIVDQNEKREKLPLEIELEFFIVGKYFRHKKLSKLQKTFLNVLHANDISCVGF